MYFNIADRILNATLGENHRLISDVTAQVQKIMNQPAGIGIKPITPKLNQDKIDGLVNRISSEENFDDVAWILDEPVVNYSQSVVDDAVESNAEFQTKAGLSPKIIRTSTEHCCKWCEEVAGTYEYPNVPQDVFRRHERCRCTVDSLSGDWKRQNVHSKKWAISTDEAQKEARKVIGLKAGDTVVKGLSDHVLERMSEREVTGEDIVDTILHSLNKTAVKYDEKNSPSFNLVGVRSTISVNPENGIITRAHKTHSKTIRRFRRGKMKFFLEDNEKRLLSEAEIEFAPEIDYSDDQAFELLDKIYEKENFFAQDAETNKNAKQLAVAYAHLADKIQATIPD